MADGRGVAGGRVAEIIGDRHVIEIAASDWRAALAAVEGDDRLVVMDGTLIRALGDQFEAVRTDLQQALIDARIRLVPASLNETLVELSRKT